MERFATNDEILRLLGISSSEESHVDMLVDIATETLADLLGIDEFGAHAVTNELIEIIRPDRVVFHQAPVDFDGTITLRDMNRNVITNCTLEQHNRSLRIARVLDEGSLPSQLGYPQIFATYTAGWNLYATIEVLVNPSADQTFYVKEAGVEEAWTFKASGATGNQINLDASAALTAAAIATALGGTLSGSTVTLPLGMSARLGTAAASSLDITASDRPAQLLMALALIVGGSYAEKSKKGGVSSYSIGPKTINFRTDEDANSFQAIMGQWLPRFKSPVTIRGI